MGKNPVVLVRSLESVFAVPATVDELRMRSEDLDQLELILANSYSYTREKSNKRCIGQKSG